MMTTKRKQQTVQFLFEASPENNITRCLISTTSNTFENYEEQNDDSRKITSVRRGYNSDEQSDGETHDDNRIEKKGSDQIHNEVNSFKQLSSAAGGIDVYQGTEQNDFSVKTKNGCDQILADKENLPEHMDSKVHQVTSMDNDRDNNMIYTKPDSVDIAVDANKRYKLKNLNGDLEEQSVRSPGDFIYNNYQPEIHSDQNTEITTSGYRYHVNFHNTNSQSTRTNPEGKESQDQLPVEGDSNHLEASHECTRLSLNIGGKNKDIKREANDNFSATNYDEHESKYLHVIEHDTQEPASAIKNLDYSKTEHGGSELSKSDDSKTFGRFIEINNNFNAVFHQTEAKYLLDHEPERQLQDLVNPQRLHEKQTERPASLRSNIDIGHRTEYMFEEDFLSTKQSGNKVRNLVHDYEIQVQGNEDHHDIQENRGIQNIPNLKCKNTIPLHVDERQLRIEERGRSIEKPSIFPGETNKQSSTLCKSELRSDESTDSHNISNSHSKPKIRSKSFLSDSSPIEELPNGSDTNNFRPGFWEHPLGINDNVNQPSLLDKKDRVPKYQPQPSSSDARVTKAHWYDIHGPLQQSSRRTRPSRHKKWKSLEELDRMEPVEEYKLPEQLSKTEAYLIGHSDTNSHSGIMHVSPIQNNYELNSTPRSHTIQNNQTFTSALHANSNQILSPDVKATTKQSPVLTRKVNASTIYSANNAEKISSAPNNNSVRKPPFAFTTARHSSSHTQKIHRLDTDNRDSTQRSRTTTVSLAPKMTKEHPSKENGISAGQIQEVSHLSGPSSLYPHQTSNYDRFASLPSTHMTALNESPIKQSPFLRRKHEQPSGKIQNINNFLNSSSSLCHHTKDHDFVSSSSSRLVTGNQSLIKRPPFLVRKHGQPTGNIENINSLESSSIFHQTNGNGNSISSSSTLASPDQSPIKRPPFLTRKHEQPTGNIENINSLKSSSIFHQTSGNGNSISSSSTLATPDQSPIKRSPLLRRKHEKPSGNGTFQHVSSDSLQYHSNDLKDHDGNLSSSLSALETLDQSPMKRSQKIKNLVNIEYYDINSDEELNSKIKRRPRTKSLNEEDKTMQYVPPRREFKSSGDLRSVGLSQEEMNVEKQNRTRGKYADLPLASNAYNSATLKHFSSNKEAWNSQAQIPRYDATKISVSSHKPNSTTKVRFYEENANKYGTPAQGQTPTYHTTMDDALSSRKNNHYLIQSRESPIATDTSKHKSVEGTHEGVYLGNDNMNNFKTNESRIDNGTKHHTKNMYSISTPKSLPNPSTPYSSKGKTDNSQILHGEDIRDTRSKSAVYPIDNHNVSEGKYNIAKAEEAWKKRYGRLPYNSKDPLHQSSDKDFGRLFQNAKVKSTSQSKTGLTKKNFSLEETIWDTSSSSVFGPDSSVNENPSCNSRSKEFSTTLHQLSSYVLSGYKGNSDQTSSLGNEKETNADVPLRYRRFYLDDEGDLSHILDNTSESRKLSMLVHCIIRLREVYSIQPFTKSLLGEHPTNLGNPQLRDAIQNKPMSVVKDIILANKSVDINTRSQSGDSALHRAAIEGDIDAIRIVINQGANVNIRDRCGFLPVHQALRYHHYKAAMFLMDCGTDLMSYTSKRIQQFATVKAISKQYLRQTLKTPL